MQCSSALNGKKKRKKKVGEEGGGLVERLSSASGRGVGRGRGG